MKMADVGCGYKIYSTFMEEYSIFMEEQFIFMEEHFIFNANIARCKKI